MLENQLLVCGAPLFSTYPKKHTFNIGLILALYVSPKLYFSKFITFSVLSCFMFVSFCTRYIKQNSSCILKAAWSHIYTNTSCRMSLNMTKSVILQYMTLFLNLYPEHVQLALFDLLVLFHFWWMENQT